MNTKERDMKLPSEKTAHVGDTSTDSDKHHNKDLGKAALVFLLWTLTSFLCHHFGKSFLAEAEDTVQSEGAFQYGFTKGESSFVQWGLACVLTFMQCLTCLFLVASPQEKGTLTNDCTQRLIIVSHVFATLATNYSMAHIEAASTFAVKLAEPVTMAVAHRLAFKTTITAHTVVSIPIIISGVLVFSGRSLLSTTGALGIGLALASNVILACRNVAIKKLHQSQASPSNSSLSPSKQTLQLRSAFTQISVLVSYSTCLAFVYLLERVGVVPRRSTSLTSFLMVSSVFHVIYSYISLDLVLEVMDVVSHSIANIFKRLLVVLLLFLAGQRHSSDINTGGLLIAAMGLGIYVKGKLQGLDNERKTMPSFDLMTRTFSAAKSWLAVLCVLCIISVFAFGTTFTAYEHSLFRNTALLNPSRIGDKKHPGVLYDGTTNSTVPIEKFLSWRIIDHPFQTDLLSRHLTTNTRVTQEAQRLHFNLLEDLLGNVTHVMLFDLATYENKGDAAIAVGEVMTLRRMNVTVVFYASTIHSKEDRYLSQAVEVSKKYKVDDLVILLQGGGNLVGYKEIDDIRQKILGRFPNHRTILLSQSIFLHKGNQGHLKNCSKLYSNRKQMIIFLRDRQSLGIARQHFNGTKLILAPDMAFGLGSVSRQLPPTHDIVWLKRRDGESSRYKLPAFPKELSVDVNDYHGGTWPSTRGTTDMESAFMIAQAGFNFLQRGRVVVTDRLHGHILSVILGIPHVLIDNPPHFKLSSFYKTWTAGLENTFLTSDPLQALEKARELLRKYDSILPPIGPTDKFNTLPKK